MREILWISLGAIAGANARYFIARWVAKLISASFPYGTLLINVETGTPVTRVTLRWAAAGDRERLRHLAALEDAPPPAGAALVAEVDGRLGAALPLDGSPPLADPFHRGSDLIELLRLRAAQLKRA